MKKAYTTAQYWTENEAKLARYDASESISGFSVSFKN